jgi:electron transfer flavoprotein alpha subunit
VKDKDMTEIWILVAANPAIDNLVNRGRELGSQLVAVVAGDRSCAEAVAASGVDRVVWLGDPGQTPVEARAAAVADLVAGAAPRVVLAAARPAERALAGAVAGRLGAPALTMVSSVQIEDDAVVVTHATFGGIAEETVRVEGPVVIVDEGGSVGSGGSVPIEEITVSSTPTLTVVETRPSSTTRVDLGKARRVVAVGRGLARREDLALVEELANALDAEVACSRPLAEGLGWLSRDRYIGVTGQHVHPDLYIALGISGQLQHVVGCRDAGTVVVVNCDAKAPYFSECDYGIVGDLAQVVPALTAALA